MEQPAKKLCSNHYYIFLNKGKEPESNKDKINS